MPWPVKPGVITASSGKEAKLTNLSLKVSDLKKDFSKFKFGPVNLKISAGECVALLGHNGAGKSTFFQMITGQLDPTEGLIEVLRKKLLPETYEIKKKLGYLPQHLDLPDWVSGEEILSYGAKLYQLPDEVVTNSIKYWEIESYANLPLASCSHGMRKRVGLALANLHQPEFLILDEPFSGLDIAHIKNLSNLILKRKKESRTTILCTHVIPYAAKLCERALLIEAGKITEMADWPGAGFEQRIKIAEDLIFHNGDHAIG